MLNKNCIRPIGLVTCIENKYIYKSMTITEYCTRCIKNIIKVQFRVHYTDNIHELGTFFNTNKFNKNMF